MSKWALRASQYLLIVTLLVSMGGHLAMLQTVAWGNMLVDFSSKSSFSEAMDKTFDGEHPCAMCKAVKKSKSEEEKKPLLKSEMKMEVALPAPVKVPFPQGTELVFSVTGVFRDLLRGLSRGADAAAASRLRPVPSCALIAIPDLFRRIRIRLTGQCSSAILGNPANRSLTTSFPREDWTTVICLGPTKAVTNAECASLSPRRQTNVRGQSSLASCPPLPTGGWGERVCTDLIIYQNLAFLKNIIRLARASPWSSCSSSSPSSWCWPGCLHPLEGTCSSAATRSTAARTCARSAWRR